MMRTMDRPDSWDNLASQSKWEEMWGSPAWAAALRLLGELRQAELACLLGTDPAVSTAIAQIQGRVSVLDYFIGSGFRDKLTEVLTNKAEE